MAVVVVFSIDDVRVSAAEFDGALFSSESEKHVEVFLLNVLVVLRNINDVEELHGFEEEGIRDLNIFRHHELPPISSCSTTILTILSSMMDLWFCAPYMRESKQDLLMMRGIPPENLKSSSMAVSVKISLSMPA